jgi:MinD-like ATPase involved in chromosome partitioning or flagellar assembly
MTLADILKAKPLADSGQETEDVKLPALKTLSAKVIVVWGSAGSGKTTLAINMGFELSSMDLKVLIIDADSYRPSIAASLGLTEPGPGITAVLRLARTTRLSIEEIERLTEEIQFGKKSLRVLTGLNAPSRWPELDPESLSGLIEFSRAHFDIIVIDVAGELEEGLVSASSEVGRNSSARAIIENADLALGVFAADPVGLNRFLWDCRNADFEFWPVANRVRASTIGKNPDRQLKDTMHRLARLEIKAVIAEDAQAVDLSLLKAQPLCLCAKNSKARESIRLLSLDVLDAS